METIQDFAEIRDYLRSTNIRVNQRLSDFVIYSFDEINADAAFALFAYRHNFFEITIEVTKGCSFKVDSFQFPEESNRISFISPRRLQTVQSNQEFSPNSKGFTLFFDSNFINNHFDNGGLLQDYPFFKHTKSPVTNLDKKLIAEITDIFAKIHYEYTEYGEKSRDIIKAYLQILLLKGKQNYRINATSSSKYGRETELTSQFELICQRDFLTYATVKEIAQKMNVSPKHLSETVKKVSGRRALDILNEYRLAKAKALLLQTTLTSTQVANELNFDSPDYFFTFFKKSTGLTPSQFRQI